MLQDTQALQEAKGEALICRVEHIWWCGSMVLWLTTRIELTRSYVSVTSEKLGTPVGKSLNCRSAPRSCGTNMFAPSVYVCMVQFCFPMMDFSEFDTVHFYRSVLTRSKFG